ncbi:MAG: AmmeMemoRadiSam system protein B [Elusimicrobiota bacterium]|jgi:hypothetical protein
MESTEKEQPIPPLRSDIEPVPVEAEGKQFLALHDPEGIAQGTVAVSPAGWALASIFDGRHTAAQIAQALSQQAKAAVSAEQIRALAAELEKADLLETEKVFHARRKILKEFQESPVRKAALADAAYPSGAPALSSLLGKFLLHDAEGPKKALSPKPSSPQTPKGLVAPHIDLARGGFAYAWSYQALSECPPPDLIVALGVAHVSPDSPWTLTAKDYETPYGPMKASAELFAEFKDLLWYDPCKDEWAHRKEHSLEFQALWLKSLWRDAAPPWLPILTSSFERFCPKNAPSSVQTMETAIEAIGRRLAERAKTQRILVLAAVDLAHVGPKFGDELKLDDALRKKVEAEDRATLEKAFALDADAFYLSSAVEGSWRHVCGSSALYTALRWMKALGAKQGKLLRYGQADDPAGGIVSFSASIFQ